MRKKEQLRKELQKQTDQNIKELEQIGIKLTSLKEHLENPKKQPFVIGSIPTSKKIVFMIME